MTQAKLQFITPVGRIVTGNLSVPSETDYHGKPRDKPQFFFGLAIPKSDQGVMDLIQKVMTHAYQGYQASQIVQQRLQDGLNARDFAWKIDDGDDPKFADRPAYAGNFILKFTTTIPLRCYDQNNVQMDPAAIKTGYFAQVAGSMAVNGNADHTAGIYMNPNGVRFIAYGEEIVSGPSPDQMFAGASVPTQLPPGASTTPVAPASQMPGMPAPQPPGMPAPQPGFTPHPQFLVPGQGQ